MHDIDTRMWADHHVAFSDAVDQAVASLRNALSRFANWDGSTHQLLALVLSFTITALTFNATTSA